VELSITIMKMPGLLCILLILWEMSQQASLVQTLTLRCEKFYLRKKKLVKIQEQKLILQVGKHILQVCTLYFTRIIQEYI
jgi:hypothetical protein